jgi:hypothetical protein
MSIGAIGGVSPAQSAAASNVGKPEPGDVRGAAGHDGDADDAGAKTAAASASGATSTGHVNVKG